MQDKNILFTGGGTAGHVIVNLALIPIFQNAGWKVDYIGSKTGIEKELIGELPDVTYHAISTGKLRRYFSIENFKDPFKVLKGTFQAWRIIGKKKPQVIFSKGGFVSVPVLLAAKMRRIPAVIHESDYTPGLANKLAVPFAKKVLTTFKETERYLPAKKTEYVGAVIRKELYSGDRDEGFKFTGLNPDGNEVLLVMGGSGGSENINELIRLNLEKLLLQFQIIHICGKDKVDESLVQPGYIQYEYVHDELTHLFEMTDFVVSRAGANAIFEFLALRIPMLLIPLGLESSRGDQIVNAKSFAKERYARVVEEKSLTVEKLFEELNLLKEFAPIMIDQMKEYDSQQALERVVEIIQTEKK